MRGVGRGVPTAEHQNIRGEARAFLKENIRGVVKGVPIYSRTL